MAGEYAVKISVRNGLILRRMKELGIKSQTELAKLAGIHLTQVNALITMRRAPLSKVTGDWNDDAYSISSALRVEPEELWTEQQRGLSLKSNSREVSMGEAEVMQLASGKDTETLAQQVLTANTVRKSLTSLTPREEQVIRRRFFEEESLEQVGERFGVNRERVRQIEMKALRKLKHPANTKLKEYWEGLEHE